MNTVPLVGVLLLFALAVVGSAWYGIDLMIAGHTHGGQFFPGTLVATVVFPFTHGLYHRGDLQVFVSQGVVTYMSRVRLGTSNELNLLRLRPKRSL